MSTKNHHITNNERNAWNGLVDVIQMEPANEELILSAYPNAPMAQLTLQLDKAIALTPRTARTSDPCFLYVFAPLEAGYNETEVRLHIGDDFPDSGSPANRDRFTIGASRANDPITNRRFLRAIQFSMDGDIWTKEVTDANGVGVLSSRVWQDWAVSFNNAAQGRITVPNGFTIQWGSINITTPNTDVKITFPVALTSLFQAFATGTAGNLNITASNILNMTVRSTTACTFAWTVFGYIEPTHRPYKSPTELVV